MRVSRASLLRAPPAEHFRAYCQHLRTASATSFANQFQTFRLVLQRTYREKKDGNVFLNMACGDRQLVEPPIPREVPEEFGSMSIVDAGTK